MDVLRNWIEPGTAVISDCWSAYRPPNRAPYRFRLCASWGTYEHDRRHVKAFLILYNWMADYVYHLAHYMFAAGCRSENVDQLTKFIDIVASTRCRSLVLIQRASRHPSVRKPTFIQSLVFFCIYTRTHMYVIFIDTFRYKLLYYPRHPNTQPFIVCCIICKLFCNFHFFFPLVALVIFIFVPYRLHPLWPQNKRLHMPWTTDW